MKITPIIASLSKPTYKQFFRDITGYQEILSQIHQVDPELSICLSGGTDQCIPGRSPAYRLGICVPSGKLIKGLPNHPLCVPPNRRVTLAATPLINSGWIDCYELGFSDL